MVQIEFFELPWGNVLIRKIETVDGRIVLTLDNHGTKITGEFVPVIQAMLKSKSEEHFTKLCEERGLLKNLT